MGEIIGFFNRVEDAGGVDAEFWFVGGAGAVTTEDADNVDCCIGLGGGVGGGFGGFFFGGHGG